MCLCNVAMHRLVAPVVAALVALTVWVGSFGWWEPVPGERWDTRLIANSTLHSFCDLNLNSWDEYALLASGGIATKAIILASTGPRRTHATLVLVETTLYAWTLATCANLWAQEPRPTYNRAPQPVDGDILMSYASRHATVSACIAVFAALVTSAHASWHLSRGCRSSGHWQLSYSDPRTENTTRGAQSSAGSSERSPPSGPFRATNSLYILILGLPHSVAKEVAKFPEWGLGCREMEKWRFANQNTQHDTRSITLGRQARCRISRVGFGVRRNGEMEKWRFWQA